MTSGAAVASFARVYSVPLVGVPEMEFDLQPEPGGITVVVTHRGEKATSFFPVGRRSFSEANEAFERHLRWEAEEVLSRGTWEKMPLFVSRGVDIHASREEEGTPREAPRLDVKSPFLCGRWGDPEYVPQARVGDSSWFSHTFD